MRAAGFLIVLYVCGIATYAVAKDDSHSLRVSFGEEFTIKESQTAFFTRSHVALKVTGFSKGVCAIPGFNCGSGWKPPMVRYELLIDGRAIDQDFTKPTKRNKEEILDVVVKESDYKTYAVLSVKPLYDECETRGTYCWEELAWKTKDESYCNNINDTSIQQRCLENIVNARGR